MITVFLVIGFIILAVENNKLRKDNFNLSKEIKRLKFEETKEEVKVLSIEEKESIKRAKEYNEEKRIIEKQNIQKRDTSDDKNIAILVTGAIFIILAAIVFLVSTWGSVNNLFKTTVLLMLVGVFFYASKIAKEKFKLMNVSTTFLYMAMAYIPICLLSISVLGLLGEYLSIKGEGRYIFLSIASAITSVIYYIDYKIRDDKNMYNAFVITNCLVFVLFGAIFEQSILVISMSLLLYSVVLNISTEKQNKETIDIVNIFTQILPIGVLIINTFHILSTDILVILNYIILLLIYIINLIKQKDIGSSIMVNAILTLLGIHFIIHLDILVGLKQMMLVLWISLIYVIINILANSNIKQMKKITSIFSFVNLQIIFGLTLFANSVNIFNEELFIQSYIIGFIQLLILITEYIRAKEFKNILSYMIPIYTIITVYTVLSIYNLSYHNYTIFAIILFIFSQILNSKILKKSFEIVSYIYLVLTYYMVAMLKIDLGYIELMYMSIFVLIQMYSYIASRNNIVKYIGYISLQLTTSVFMQIANLSNMIFAVLSFINLIIISYIENSYIKQKDNIAQCILWILKIYLWTLIFPIGNMITLVYSTYLLIENRVNKVNKYLDILPCVAIVVVNNLVNYNIEALNLLLNIVITLIFTTVSLNIKKEGKYIFNIYTIASAICMFSILDRIDITNINEILLLIFIIINIFGMKNSKIQDLYKIAAVFTICSLYTNIVSKANLDMYMSVNILKYIVIAIYILKNIVSKYIEQTDGLEMIVFLFIYLIAMFNPYNTTDSVSYITILCAIIIFAYMKQYGTIFCISIGAIIVNTIYLTRSLWFSIPWYVYLLAFGSVLITFAIKNEASQQKQSKNISSKIKYIKDMVDGK